MPPNLETDREQLIRTAMMAVRQVCTVRTVARGVVELPIPEMVRRVTAQSMARLKHSEPERPGDIVVSEVGCALFAGSSIPVEFPELPWLVCRVLVGQSNGLAWYMVSRPTTKFERLMDIASPFNAFDSVFTNLWSTFERLHPPVEVARLRDAVHQIICTRDHAPAASADEESQRQQQQQHADLMESWFGSRASRRAATAAAGTALLPE